MLREEAPVPSPWLIAALSVSLVSPLLAQRNHIGNARPTTIMATTGTKTYFAGSDGKNGVELWETSGTSASTKMVHDIFTGSKGSYPHDITAANGTLAFSGSVFFTARKPTSGDRVLYYYLPFLNTPRPFSDIVSGTIGTDPSDLVNVNGAVFYTATTVANGRELWASYASPTLIGTTMIEIYAGATGSAPDELTALGGVLYFTATHPTNGRNLYRYPPTSGTAPQTIFFNGKANARPSELTVFNGALYLAANEGSFGREIWKVSGTTATRITDIQAGSKSSNPTQLTAGKDHLAFVADWPLKGPELCRVSTTGTVQLLSDFGRGESIHEVTAGEVGTENIFWFAVDTDATGKELWRTNNNTPPGVEQVHDLVTGPESSNPVNLTAKGKTLIFRASKVPTGAELYKTDGTTEKLILDINTGRRYWGEQKSSFAGPLVPFGSSYLFAAEGDRNGIELWSTDGSSARQVVSGLGMDPDPVLPQQWISLSPLSVTIELTDAPASKPGFTVVSNAVSTNINPWPGLIRGAVMVNLSSANSIWIPIMTNKDGNMYLQKNVPKIQFGSTPLAWQSFVRTSGVNNELFVASSNWTCDVFDPVTTSGGVTAQGDGCADDDTGEYDITVTGQAGSGWVALVRLKPSGEQMLIDDCETTKGAPCCPITDGEVIPLQGVFNFNTPIDEGDSTINADRLQLLLFDNEPDPSNLGIGKVVWQSYC